MKAKLLKLGPRVALTTMLWLSGILLFRQWRERVVEKEILLIGQFSSYLID
jgi:hypothetical protein